MDGTRSRLEDAMWRRHANPLSGWTRLPTGPLLVYAVYRRDRRLLLAALGWAAINPFVFPPPRDQDAWMTRAVLAERWWVRERGEGTVGTDYPNVCNTVGALGFLLALACAWTRRPVGAALGTIVGAGSKLWWIGALVRRYDAQST